MTCRNYSVHDKIHGSFVTTKCDTGQYPEEKIRPSVCCVFVYIIRFVTTTTSNFSIYSSYFLSYSLTTIDPSETNLPSPNTDHVSLPTLKVPSYSSPFHRYHTSNLK